METKIRVFLVDDHPLVLLGLSTYFRSDGRVEVVGQASSGQQALDLIASKKPDLVLLDILMPGMDGIEIAQALAESQPEVKVLFLTGLPAAEATRLLVGTRACGFLSKMLTGQELADRICEVGRGIALGPSDDRLVGRTQPVSRNLSPREHQVLALLADGNSNKQIATALGLSARTVEKHRAHVMDKLGLKSVALLTKYAVAQGISGPL